MLSFLIYEGKVAVALAVVAAPLAVTEAGRGPAPVAHGEHHLKGVGMAGEHQVDVAVGQCVGTPGIGVVLQQNLEIAVCQSTVSLSQVAMLFKRVVTEILGTDEYNLVFTTLDERVVIIKQFPPSGLLQVTQRLAIGNLGVLVIPTHVVVVVVVAEHREHAVGCM